MRPCFCNRFIAGGEFVVRRDCRLCWLYAHDETYRNFWDRSSVTPQANAPRPLCIHLGEFIRSEVCTFCKARRRLTAVHACAIWGTCSIKPYRAGQPENDCRSCPQYAAPPMQPGHLPAIPAGFTLAMPPGLTPLPAGRDTFNREEWRLVPKEHKEFYQALKRYRDRNEQPPPANPEAHAMPRDRSPFSDTSGRPIFLSSFGQAASAFLVLGGPSLLEYDLSLLQRRGIFTMAVNNAGTMLRPNSWMFVDTPGKFHDSIWRDPAVLKFVRKTLLNRGLRARRPDGSFRNLETSEGKHAVPRDMPGIIAWDHNADFEPARWLAEPSINWGQSKKSAARSRDKYPQILNSMFASLKLLYATGFRVVYLLGCDFQMREEQPYAFAQTKAAGGVRSNNGSYIKLNQMLGMLAPYFTAAGFHVFNCNKTSGLTVFPHVSYADAIGTATRDFVETADRIRADGWYNGHAGD